MARTRAGGAASAGLFEPAVKWLRKKIARGGRYHHIFRGEVRRGPGGNLRGSGWHHRFMGQDPPDRRVTQINRTDVNGTYHADVQMRGPGGQWYDKPGGSSFFPDNWTPQRVDRTINDAFAGSSPIPGTNNRRWEGVADGIPIQGSYRRNGRDWDSGWPVVQ